MNPGTPGSFINLLGSPVRLPAPAVEPWYDLYMENTFHLPVEALASFIAFSFASAPAFVKNILAPSKPDNSTSILADCDLTSIAYPGPMKAILSAWSLIASITALLPNPRFKLTSCDDISAYCFPSSSQK